jgi:uncharacterized protein YbgA (DUF1722 family)/uncharacterized protein YbbK (DUF523 family)
VSAAAARGAGDPRIRVGVSSCLLGETVRYDGGHKRDAYLADVLGQFVAWVPVCPELESGLGVPRPPMRLVRDGAGVRLVEIASGADRTRAVARWASARLRALRSLELCGYILKKDSPSCGMERVKVYAARRPTESADAQRAEGERRRAPARQGMPERNGTGVYARALREAFPDLPIEEEGRLRDPELRENFVERVFAYARLRALFRARWRPGDAVAFHTAHKLQLMAHSPVAYRELGRHVAAVARARRGEFRERYAGEFMAALARIATRGRNANVLQHCAGHLKRALGRESRAELASLIDDYRRGLVPLVVPVTLIRHHTRQHGIAYLTGQTYLEPHPKELTLRNHC